MEQNPDIQQEQTPDNIRQGRSRFAKGCGITAAVVAIGVALLLIYVVRTSEFKLTKQCIYNMLEIHGAIQRYYDVNSTYPPDLGALKKEYLKRPSILYEPRLKHEHNEYSYTYHRPGTHSKGNFIILECDLYKMNPKTPIRLLMTKDGNIKAEEVTMKSEKTEPGSKKH